MLLENVIFGLIWFSFLNQREGGFFCSHRIARFFVQGNFQKVLMLYFDLCYSVRHMNKKVIQPFLFKYDLVGSGMPKSSHNYCRDASIFGWVSWC